MQPFLENLRELFSGANRNHLDAYFLAFRDFTADSIIPTRDMRGMDIEQLSVISSTLNRFHESGSINQNATIHEILERLFYDQRENLLIVQILIEGCNRKVQKELRGKIKPLDPYAKGSAINFQSIVEAVAEALRMRVNGYPHI